jgi:hypothetical protein
VTDEKTALRILEALRRGPVGDAGVLVGSSGLFGFETQVPALTEDIDVAVPETSMRHQVEVELGRLSALPERLDA